MAHSLKYFLLSTFLFSLFAKANIVFALEAPQLISPPNGSTVSSSKLEWSTPSYALFNQGSPYVVNIKNIPDFNSDDNIYKTNTYYTPQLSFGTWYWRVKAKDQTATWSDWSPTWSFTLSENSPSPIPSPSTQTITTSPSPSPKQNIFTISNIPNKIDLNQSFNVDLNLSLPSNPNSIFYLKGAFLKPGSTNYFGLTNTANGWSKNGSSASSQKQITTDDQGNWSGTLEVKVDSDDSGYQGEASYIFKVGRYNSAGSALTWSNELNINISGSSQPSSSSNLQTINPNATPDSRGSTPKTTSKIKIPNLTNKEGSVAGIASKSADHVLTKSERKINYLFILAGLLTLAGGGFYLVKLIKNR